MKYHVSPAGNVGRCGAKIHCPYGDLKTDHYPSVAEAQAGYEARMRERRAIFSPLSKTESHVVAPSSLTHDLLASIPEEKKNLALATVGRALTRSTGPERAYWQALYDSTPAGALYLERKRKEESPEYEERKENLARLLESQSENTVPEDLPLDPGLTGMATDFSTSEPEAYPDRESLTEVKAKLALLSGAWTTVLSPEEVEAVSWVTSNGAAVLNAHASGKEHSIWSHEVYSKDFLDSTLEHFRSAMAKAPELDEPIVIFRGTSADRVEDTLLDRPASASASGSVAKSFDGRNDDGTANEDSPPVIVEVRTRKVPAVTGMSAWGSSELEVILPLGRYRKVGDFETLRGLKDTRGYRQVEIDPELDKIRIVQLEYLGP